MRTTGVADAGGGVRGTSRQKAGSVAYRDGGTYGEENVSGPAGWKSSSSS